MGGDFSRRTAARFFSRDGRWSCVLIDLWIVRVTDDEREAIEERAAIIQFCSGREISREESERIAAAQMGIHEEEMEFLMGESMEIK